MIHIKTLLATLGVLFLMVSRAQADASEQLVNLLNQTETFQANFLQQIQDGQGGLIQETTGQIKAKQPGRFYWHAEPPLEQLVVGNGETVWVYDPDLEQVMVQKLDNRVAATPALLLSGEAEKLRDAYTVTQANLPDGSPLFNLIPKDPDSIFQSLQMGFSGDILQEMRLQDSLGQRTYIAFEQVILNDPIDNDLFEFTPPEGVDVISE